MNDRLEDIGVFAQVVEAGNFAAAAEKLHLTRSAVGKVIARLEHRLGVRLFQRTTRQQNLTEAGQVYYEHSLRILAEMKLAEAALDNGRSTPSGKLRVSVPILFGRLHIAPLLTGLVCAHSEMSLEVSFSDHTVDLVQEGYDLAVRIGPLADSPSLVARRIGTQRMAICGSPKYFAKYGRPETFQDLVDHVGIIYSRPGMNKQWLVKDPQQQLQSISIPPRIFLDDVQAIADAALAGLGLAWLPCWLVAHHFGDGSLQRAFGEFHVIESGIHAIWPKASYMPLKTRVAIDRLVQNAGEWGNI
ncbi:LysR family transcriptional regulator [Hahella sp. CCB-MM4]|uniref:LysR family transcriptional regulator n=1 Tax=Hahella sp. (strain CCB-MM4) TaxID=1926491 RepID=UPI000B9A6AA5|nr:LysR family transcriptional regulator [Hahella sp. CCB-MM4]OZG71755.1 LysR family transcriptional regulator [Hahella sp. CCB-MM4]